MHFISGRYATKDIELLTLERSQVFNYKHYFTTILQSTFKKIILIFLELHPFFQNKHSFLQKLHDLQVDYIGTSFMTNDILPLFHNYQPSTILVHTHLHLYSHLFINLHNSPTKASNPSFLHKNACCSKKNRSSFITTIGVDTHKLKQSDGS